MPRTLKEIQEDAFKLCEEVRAIGAASQATGFQAVPYLATQAAFAGHRFHDALEKLAQQQAADQRADAQMDALTAMQRAAGAFAQVTQ